MNNVRVIIIHGDQYAIHCDTERSNGRARYGARREINVGGAFAYDHGQMVLLRDA